MDLLGTVEYGLERVNMGREDASEAWRERVIVHLTLHRCHHSRV